MPRLPRDVSGAECIRILQRLGFQVLRQKGSHVSLRRVRPDGGQTARLSLYTAILL